MNLFKKLTSWRRSARPGRDQAWLWQPVFSSLPILAGMNPRDQQRLLKLAEAFLRDKTLEPVAGLTLQPADRAALALQACLPVLELGLGWYSGWYAVVIYPDEFVPAMEETDEAGVVHSHPGPRSGESWSQGGVILSLQDMRAAGHGHGHNVIIHEMAHKLDMRNGDSNGFPPLHRGMQPADWSRAFSEAYEDMCRRIEAGDDTPIDPYAAESPAECFAVFSEVFFEQPARLWSQYPAAYQQLSQFYRQDPAGKMT